MDLPNTWRVVGHAACHRQRDFEGLRDYKHQWHQGVWLVWRGDFQIMFSLVGWATAVFLQTLVEQLWSDSELHTPVRLDTQHCTLAV